MLQQSIMIQVNHSLGHALIEKLSSVVSLNSMNCHTVVATVFLTFTFINISRNPKNLSKIVPKSQMRNRKDAK